jgi:tetratricopeptide (TPR) repeat protein
MEGIAKMRPFRLMFFSCLLFLGGCTPQFYSGRGWAYLDKDKPDEAIKWFQLSHKTPDDLPGYYNGMFYAYVLKKDYAEAEKYLYEGLKRYPDFYHLNYAAGKYCLKISKDYSAAIKYFEKCKILDQKKQFTRELDSLIIKKR